MRNTILATVMAVAALCFPPRATAQAPGSGGSNAPGQRDKPYIILISFDAFRWDYLDRGITPNFARLARRGARAEALIPVFPTKTYPNHYAIATGLYAGRHGLLGNEFYEPKWNATYRMSDRSTVEDGRWYGGEPIWVTAEKQGMVSAAMFFVGTEAPVQGIQPTHWNIYNHTLPIATRLDSVLTWLRLPPETRPHVITLYFPQVDDAGHRHGPDSPALNAAVASVDSALGRLLDDVATLPHGDQVHIIAVSDHGLARADRGIIVLDDYAQLENLVVVTASTLAHVYLHGDTTRGEAVVKGLQRAPHLRVFRRADIPAEWGVKMNPRVGDILIVADEGWLLRTRGGRVEANPATHGWAPAPNMRGIFVAAGPGIRAGVRIPAFENIHIYPLMAALLGLTPAPDIDGRLDVLSPIMTQATPPRRPLPH
jgi:predicted AlkP superfamily pyrophosphatase or phosphodiesterase